MLVLALLAPAAAALRSKRLPLGSSAALAGGVAFLVHAGLDWDWEFPAVTVVGIACLAAAPPKTGPVLGLGPRVTLLVLEGAVLVAYGVYLLIHNA